MTKISNKFHQVALSVINFLVIVESTALELEKVPTFSSFNPCPSLPSVTLDDRKKFHCLNIPFSNKSGPLYYLEFNILGDPGTVSRIGKKVFKHGRRSPWVSTLTEPFPNGQANAGSWLGTKNAVYYCAQSANNSS